MTLLCLGTFFAGGTARAGRDAADRARYAPQWIAQPDSLQEVGQRQPLDSVRTIDRLNRRAVREATDTLAPALQDDSTQRALPKPDSVRIRKTDNFLDDVITFKNTDSLVYDTRNKMVYIYREGDVNYKTMNMKADYMRINMDTKEMFARGIPDTLGVLSRPQFADGGQSYDMDSMVYNISSGKAKIRGVTTKDGEGFLIGNEVKKMKDNSINISNGKYTTCDHTEDPHFYLAMTRAKVIPGKKIITGPAYLVMEGVPIYFLGIPEAFFPTMSEKQSGFIVPSYGEEYVKGFFLRDGGYYFNINDYVDLTVLGGIYTLGSWEASVSSRYTRRYKYNGNFSFRYSKDIIGERGASDYVNTGNMKIAWTHSQDAKFRPNSNFSASVNFSTSGYAKYGSTTLNDYLSTQTNSSISYSKSWAGTPFSFSTNIQQSQNSRDSTYSFSLPNVVFNMSRINPFKRKSAVGKERWYEKIALTYTGTLANNVSVKEKDLFSEKMFKDMKNGVNHTVPISTSFNLFNYINISPNANYQERWYFRKISKQWNPDTKRIEVADTTAGFYRVYNYSVAASASTKIYGTLQFKSPTFPIQAVRHVITPSVSFSYAPDFSKPRYGYYQPVQSDSTGRVTTYSPFEGAMYGVPGKGRTGSLSFSLQNTLEMKVLSKQDTSGLKKIKLLDNLSLGGSYNFLADSMRLSTISINIRTTIKKFGINLTAVLDPYEVNPKSGTRYNRLTWSRGNLGRIASTGWSFGYTFNSKKSNQASVNDITSQGIIPPEYQNPFLFDEQNPIDPITRRQLMTTSYYDFSIPWNLGFSYSIAYTNNGVKKNVVQTLNFNGSINLTPKWGIAFNGGFDFESMKLTPGVFTLSRDLHCWQMSFNWVPVGFRKSWSFNISVKSALLKDLKYDRNSSHYDNLSDN